MYSKSESKGPKHEWIPSAPSIVGLSYIYIRTFDISAGKGMFSSLTCPSLSSSTILGSLSMSLKHKECLRGKRPKGNDAYTVSQSKALLKIITKKNMLSNFHYKFCEGRNTYLPKHQRLLARGICGGRNWRTKE